MPIARFKIVLLVLVASHAQSLARAEFEIVIHGKGSGGTPDAGTVGFPYTESLSGTDSGMLSQEGSGNGNGNHYALTTATVVGGGTFSNFLDLYSAASNERSGTFVPFGVANTGGLWTDVVTLNGSAALPSSIRLHFAVAGMMQSTLFDGTQATTLNGFAARVTSDPTVFEGNFDAIFYTENPRHTNFLSATSTIYEFGDGPQGPESMTQNWDTLQTGVAGSFSGTFSLDVSYDAELSAYDWAVMFTAFARTQGGNATTAIPDMSLVAVTDLTNNELEDFVVTFESGRGVTDVTQLSDFDADGDTDGHDFLVWQRNPSVGSLTDWQSNYGSPNLLATSVAVPEPSTWMLLVLAVMGSNFTLRRRIS